MYVWLDLIFSFLASIEMTWDPNDEVKEVRNPAVSVVCSVIPC